MAACGRGWGRRAADFATLSEPGNSREYVSLHQQLAVGAGDRVLDIACGAGLAVEMARARGATCSGIDASPRLIAVARDRTPQSDLRVGDMNALPWEDGAFEVVTSFRGIWGTTPDAVAEVHRVLAPGGRVGISVWGHIKASSGAWALAPFRLASQPKVENQAAMVALGRPGGGEELLASCGFVGISRIEIPFVWEFADPETYVCSLASTGPAYEAIQAAGEVEFVEYATNLARERVRDGLPLRAHIDVVGYVARKPVAPASVNPAPPPNAGLLTVPEVSDEIQRLYDDDVDKLGFGMNASQVWAHDPAAHDALFDLINNVARAGSLTFRQRGVLVSACASTMGDSYCSLAWGWKLASAAGADVAGGVLRGDDDLLDDSDRALARWARRVTRDPNTATATDVDALRAAGFTDAQIFAITTFIGLRIAFSTVNEALGARPDRELGEVGSGPST